jgi:hypothetical protein
MLLECVRHKFFASVIEKTERKRDRLTQEDPGNLLIVLSLKLMSNKSNIFWYVRLYSPAEVHPLSEE